MEFDFESALMEPDCSLRELMDRMGTSSLGIILIVDGDRRLLATVTDGDVRRAILAGIDLQAPARDLLKTHVPGPDPGGPITAPLGSDSATLIHRMQKYFIRHIPLLDAEGRVAGLARLEDLVGGPEPMRAVVMAGGLGKRLRPLTETTPKPLLPVGEQPLISRLVEGLRDAGIERVSVTTHFLSERVQQLLGDGSSLGVSIDYVPEDKPLGTAGSLSLMQRPQEPTLVINGDILTRLNFRAMGDFHRDYGADMTVAVSQYDVQVPYGVVECEGANLLRLVEKPTMQFFVVAGIYLLEPTVWDYLVAGELCQMPELIERLVAAGRKVVQFPVSEYWLDIGSLEHYQQAQEDALRGRV